MVIKPEIKNVGFFEGAEEKIINESDVNALVDHLENLASQTFVQEFTPSFSQVLLAAEVFLQGVKMLNDQQQNVDILTEAKKRYQQAKDNGINPIETVKIEDWENGNEAFIWRSKYRLAFDFDLKLKAFLGEPPTTIIVVMKNKASSQQKVTSYELSPQGLLHFINAKKTEKKGIVPYLGFTSKTAVQKYAISDNQKPFEAEFNKKQLLTHLKTVQKAYQGTAARMEKFFKVHGNTKDSALLMWKENTRKWTVTRVLKYGDVKEAYIAALMVDHQGQYDKLCTMEPGFPEYYDHMFIKTFFYEYITKVDNMPAIIEEDVKTENKQYGVKSEGADPPGFDQYINTANMLINLGNGIISQTLLKEAIKTTNDVALDPHGVLLGSLNSQANELSNTLIKKAINMFKS